MDYKNKYIIYKLNIFKQNNKQEVKNETSKKK